MHKSSLSRPIAHEWSNEIYEFASDPAVVTTHNSETQHFCILTLCECTYCVVLRGCVCVHRDRDVHSLCSSPCATQLSISSFIYYLIISANISFEWLVHDAFAHKKKKRKTVHRSTPCLCRETVQGSRGRWKGCFLENLL